MRHSWLALSACLLGSLSLAQVDLSGDPVRLTGDGWSVDMRRADGAVVGFSGTGGALPLSEPVPLWSLAGEEGISLTPGAASWAETAEGLRATWDQPTALVSAELRPAAVGLEITIRVTSREGTWLDLNVPGRIRLDPANLAEAIVPANGNDGVGLALQGSWFARQDAARPTSWQPETVGGAAYDRLFGGAPTMHELSLPPAPLTVTAAGAALFSETLAQRLAGAQMSAFRPSPAAQVSAVLLETADGPAFVRRDLGAGALWRLGGRLTKPDSDPLLSAVAATLDSLPATAQRRRVGVLALQPGPTAGNFTTYAPADWLGALSRSAAAMGGTIVVESVDTLAALDAALASDETLALLNPYGEWLPVPLERTMDQQIDRLVAFMEGGGHWFEVAGYPFHAALRPAQFYDYSVPYPAAFADFVHLRGTGGGQLAIYRRQPRAWEPWAGAQDPAQILAPGRLACGGEAEGGWLQRGFGIYLHPGDSWTTPPTRIAPNLSAEAALADYAQINQLTRPLADKMDAATWAKMRDSVLVYLAGTLAEKEAATPLLPLPTLVHFADYLKGGFDKEYPDHLPPHPRFGTQAEFARWCAELRAMGHLVSPYTNPTWWCDEPPGPSFIAAGNDPLLLNRDGRPNRELYGTNPGWTITFWHPAVRAANEETRRQFTQDIPVDILFQDQCGARSWHYDLNPASPTPTAYIEGLLSMVDEDARVVPLGTESGWDGVVNGEVLLAGLSWRLTSHRPERHYSQAYDRSTWRTYPLAQRLARENCVLMMHDLGQFCEDDATLAQCLSLGFSLSWRVGAAALDRPGAQAWLGWLDRLQKSVVGPSLAQPVHAFEHTPGTNDDGLLAATYGDLELVVNLSDAPRATPAGELAAWGFAARRPGVHAAMPADSAAYVAEAGRAWVRGRPEETVRLTLPAGAAAVPTQVRVESPVVPARTVAARAEAGAVVFELPLLVETAAAPAVWPGQAVAVLDFGAAASLSWTQVTPTEWIAALTASDLGAPRVLGDGAALAAALAAGPGDVWAIVNPYGENVPGTGGAALLDAIEAWIEAGGVWWETGGYPFVAVGGERLGPGGIGRLGIGVGPGDVDQPAEALAVTELGRAWLGPAASAAIEARLSSTNRGLPRRASEMGHQSLVRGAITGADFAGGYRLGGHGWLLRLGGLDPEPTVAQTIVVGSLEYLASRPPLPRAAADPTRFWTVSW